MSDIFTGIMMILFGIGLFTFGLFMKRRKIDNYDLYDGTIISVNPETRDIAITYKVNDMLYYTGHHIPDFEDMPEVDLKLCVQTYAGNPQKVFNICFNREYGGNTSSKHKYMDNNNYQNRYEFILLSYAFFIFGFSKLLQGLNMI